MGIDNFGEVIKISSKEFKGKYYGKPSDAEWLVSAAYFSGLFIELIQPVSGRSIFQDYLDKNPTEGVQHIAYSMPAPDIDKVISKLTDNGFQVITSLSMPVAEIFFLDTYEEIGVITEIIGITEEGKEFVEKMKTGKK